MSAAPSVVFFGPARPSVSIVATVTQAGMAPREQASRDIVSARGRSRDTPTPSSYAMARLAQAPAPPAVHAVLQVWIAAARPEVECAAQWYIPSVSQVARSPPEHADVSLAVTAASRGRTEGPLCVVEEVVQAATMTRIPIQARRGLIVLTNSRIGLMPGQCP
jgi:hypothetical protein